MIYAALLQTEKIAWSFRKCWKITYTSDMASYFDEHDCEPLADGEQPNHMLHMARYVSLIGITDQLLTGWYIHQSSEQSLDLATLKYWSVKSLVVYFLQVALRQWISCRMEYWIRRVCYDYYFYRLMITVTRSIQILFKYVTPSTPDFINAWLNLVQKKYHFC